MVEQVPGAAEGVLDVDHAVDVAADVLRHALGDVLREASSAGVFGHQPRRAADEVGDAVDPAALGRVHAEAEGAAERPLGQLGSLDQQVTIASVNERLEQIVIADVDGGVVARLVAHCDDGTLYLRGTQLAKSQWCGAHGLVSSSVSNEYCTSVERFTFLMYSSM